MALFRRSSHIPARSNKANGKRERVSRSTDAARTEDVNVSALARRETLPFLILVPQTCLSQGFLNVVKFRVNFLCNTFEKSLDLKSLTSKSYSFTRGSGSVSTVIRCSAAVRIALHCGLRKVENGFKNSVGILDCERNRNRGEIQPITLSAGTRQKYNKKRNMRKKEEDSVRMGRRMEKKR